MDEKALEKLQTFAKNVKQLKVSDAKDTVTELKKIYDCEYESCLLKKDEIVETIGSSEAMNQLENRFKPKGPYDSKEWFSNVNIDKVLDQFATKYQHKNFLHIEFQMSDFEDAGGSLSRINLVDEYNKGVRCFGVVFNTDVSSGSGEHWFAVFGDMSKEPFTIEYFNSSKKA